MQPQKCNAQHAGVQQMQQNRLRQLLTGTVSLLLREEVSFREIFLHKGKFTGSSTPSGKRSLNCSALVQGPLKPENHQGKVKLLGHSSNCWLKNSESERQLPSTSFLSQVQQKIKLNYLNWCHAGIELLEIGIKKWWTYDCFPFLNFKYFIKNHLCIIFFFPH